ncbi:hypothetical protein F4775DRAFT_533933 [Biscogniauxia sp. FL1348]|nr:hypothetical protein F4775DRAFT_533933 [Biscogniauxia sp. FL1348]
MRTAGTDKTSVQSMNAGHSRGGQGRRKKNKGGWLLVMVVVSGSGVSDDSGVGYLGGLVGWLVGGLVGCLWL